MEIQIRKDILDCKVLVGEEECQSLMDLLGLNLNFDDALDKLNNLLFIKKNYLCTQLKKVMSNRGIKPPVYTLRADELCQLLLNRIRYTIEFRSKRKKDHYRGVLELEGHRYLVVLNLDDEEIPIAIFKKKKHAAVAYDTIIFHLTNDRSLMNFPDSNRKLSSLKSQIPQAILSMLLLKKPVKDVTLF